MSEAFAVLKQQAERRWRELNEAEAWIRVGTDLSGQAAGALAVVEALATELQKHQVQATLTEVGCLGLCFAEPLVDVKVPGGKRVLYKNVTPQEVPEIIEAHLVRGEPRVDLALAALEEPVLGLPLLEELPEMRGQLRIALRNCGHIDPTDVYQYIAREGFRGLG